jgi:predicted metal-dependent hydrolase
MLQPSRQLSFEDAFGTAPPAAEPPSHPPPSAPAAPPPLTNPLSYTLERSVRRKSSIQITVLPDLTLRVVAPLRLARGRIDAMVRGREAWIRKRRAELQQSQLGRQERRWSSGERLPFLDDQLELRIRPVVGQKIVQVMRKESYLDVWVPTGLESIEPIKRVVYKWYGIKAQQVFAQRVLHFAEPLNVEPFKVLVRNQTSRWGSCASDGSLRLCWRLILAPQRILDYVVVHELSHLRHPHHQRSFWQCVKSILPNYAELRAELKRDGDTYRL